MRLGEFVAQPPFGTNVFDGIQVVNDYPSSEFGTDRFVLSGRLTGPNFNQFAPLGFLSLDDTSRAAFSNTHLNEIGDLSGWPHVEARSGSWYIAFSAGGSSPKVAGIITEVTRVP
jgi:hypothetical protein